MTGEFLCLSRKDAVAEAVADARLEAFHAGRPVVIVACHNGRGCTHDAETCDACETITVHPLGRVERDTPSMN